MPETEIRNLKTVTCCVLSTRLDSTWFRLVFRFRLGLALGEFIQLGYFATVNVRRRPGTEMETEIECGPNCCDNADKTRRIRAPVEANRRATRAECRVPSTQYAVGAAKLAVLKRLPIALRSSLGWWEWDRVGRNWADNEVSWQLLSKQLIGELRHVWEMRGTGWRKNRSRNFKTLAIMVKRMGLRERA